MPRIPFLALVAIAFTVQSAVAQKLRLVAHNDLGGKGLNGSVVVVGSTAIVAAGVMPAAGVHAHLYNPYTCGAVDVKLLDMSKPASPRLTGHISLPAGISANDISARRVHTSSFAGDLLAVALTMCGGDGNTVDRGIAYYDVTDAAHPALLGRYIADADSMRADSIPPCGPPPRLSPERCAASQHTVQLVDGADGRILSISTEPGASASNFPSGDVRIVDVTNPAHPVLLSSFPGRKEPIFSTNGCRPFRAAHDARIGPDGRSVLVAFYDGGLLDFNIGRPESPLRTGALDFGTAREVEGNAGYLAAAMVNGKPTVLMSEQDWLPVETYVDVLSVDSKTPTTAHACEAVFTLYDPDRNAQIYNHAGHHIDAGFVYVGRGCPGGSDDGMHDMAGMHPVTAVSDDFLSDPAGKIVLLDRSAQATQAGLPAGPGCSMSARVLRAQRAGAVGVIIAQTSTTAPEAFAPDGDPTSLSIPAVQIDKADGDRLRAAVCPTIENGHCARGTAQHARLRDEPGTFGGVRVIDVSNPSVPKLVTVLHSPHGTVFPPRDLGVYAPNRPAIDGDLAFVPWNSDGVRVIDMSRDVPRLTASFVPHDSPDPTGQLPAKSYVIGVALLHAGPSSRATHLLVTDLNSGLYVLEIRAR